MRRWNVSEQAKVALAAMYADKPLVFGHRGASADAPMNTLVAFELAAERGAQGIELDVHRTKDGALVVLHDFEVDATTDGSGVISEMTLAEIKTLDAGSWFAPSFAGVHVPTLDQVFEAVGRRLYINVEIKSRSADTDGTEQAVADCIVRHQLSARVIVSSFNPLTLQRFRAVAPDVPLAYLDAPDIPDELRALMRDFPHEAQHPHANMVDTAYVQQAQAAGRYINVWTVNDPSQARSLVAMGVNGIITDMPGVMRGAIG